MADSLENTFIPHSTECSGAPDTPEAPHPLSRDDRQAIVVLYGRDGRVLGVCGCGHRVGDRCLVPGRTAENAPECLWNPDIEKVVAQPANDWPEPENQDAEKDTTEAAAAETLPAVVPGSGDIDINDGEQLKALLSIIDTGGLILAPEMQELHLTPEEALREGDRTAKVTAALGLLLDSYANAIRGVLRKPRYFERLVRTPFLGWPFTFIPVIIYRGGEKTIVLNKRLPNGRSDEYFKFRCDFNWRGMMERAYVIISDDPDPKDYGYSSKSTLDITFKNGSIDHIKAHLEKPLRLLRTHGLDSSELYKLIEPAVPAGVSSDHYETSVELNREKLNLLISTTSRSHTGTGSYINVAFSAQEGKFVYKDSNEGISYLRALLVIKNLLDLLPFPEYFRMEKK